MSECTSRPMFSLSIAHDAHDAPEHKHQRRRLERSPHGRRLNWPPDPDGDHDVHIAHSSAPSFVPNTNIKPVELYPFRVAVSTPPSRHYLWALSMGSMEAKSR
ncbi:hypothetical protein OF83DRAFT_1170992 [Amylostereum chailletii]|nr:hypothetical protein OF83DRAFT_1170992 [Amylostereum chailletii]